MCERESLLLWVAERGTSVSWLWAEGPPPLTLVICTIGEILPSLSYWELVWVEDAAVNRSEGKVSASPEPGNSKSHKVPSWTYSYFLFL